MQTVFLTLAILFFGLAAFHFTGIEIIGLASGFVGIICGAAAVYTSMGLVLKEAYGREILRLGEPVKPGDLSDTDAA
jgi:succinate-acetate transporter protein